MSTTPKASRRPRGTHMSWQPPRTVWGRKEYYRAGGDDPMDRWYGKRRCNGTCAQDPTIRHPCSAIARLHRVRRAYARRR